MFEIPAGGRRYRALELLVKQKRLAKHRADPLRRAHRGHRRGGQPRRERPARAAAPARPVPRLPRLAREGPVRGGDRRRLLRLGRRGQAAPAARLGLAEAARRLCRGRHDASTSSWPSPSAPTTSARSRCSEAISALLQQGAVCHPPHADRGRGAGERQARAVRRLEAYDARRRRRPARPVPGRRRRLAAGRRHCSSAWSPRSWSETPMRSAPRAGSGSRSRRLPLWPYLWPAPTSRASGAADAPRRKAARRGAAGRGGADRGDACEAAEELPEDVDQRLGEIETALAAIEERPVRFDPAEIARAGAFVSIDGAGRSAHRARLRSPRGRAAGRARTGRAGGRERDGRRRPSAGHDDGERQRRPSPEAGAKRMRASGRSPTGC